MNKTDKIWFAGTLLFSGFIVGLGLGLCLMVPKTTICRDTVLHCRQMMAAINDLPPAENARFWRITRSAPHLVELWNIRAAIAQIPLNDDAATAKKAP